MPSKFERSLPENWRENSWRYRLEISPDWEKDRENGLPLARSIYNNFTNQKRREQAKKQRQEAIRYEVLRTLEKEAKRDKEGKPSSINEFIGIYIPSFSEYVLEFLQANPEYAQDHESEILIVLEREVRKEKEGEPSSINELISLSIPLFPDGILEFLQASPEYTQVHRDEFLTCHPDLEERFEEMFSEQPITLKLPISKSTPVEEPA